MLMLKTSAGSISSRRSVSISSIGNVRDVRDVANPWVQETPELLAVGLGEAGDKGLSVFDSQGENTESGGSSI